MADTKKGLQVMKDVPFIVYESEMARLERIIKKQFILILVTIAFLVGTNACWIWYESQWEDVTTTTTEQEVTQDANGGGNNTFIGGDNVETDSTDENDNN